MNLQQRIFLWVGILVFAFLTLRAPWIAVYPRPIEVLGGTPYEESLGSHFLWSDLQSRRSTVRVDFQRLVLEWLVLTAVTVALFWTFKGRPDWQLGGLRAAPMRLLRRISVPFWRQRGARSVVLIAGLLLLLGPVVLQWGRWRWQTKLYAEGVADFGRKIPELARRYPAARGVDWSRHSEKDGNFDFVADKPAPQNSAPDVTSAAFPADAQCQVVEEESPFDVPGIGQVNFSDRMSGREIADALRTKYPQLPTWYLDAVAVEVNPRAVPGGDKPGDPPAPFSLWGALLHNFGLESMGLALLVVAVAGLRRSDQQKTGVHE